MYVPASLRNTFPGSGTAETGETGAAKGAATQQNVRVGDINDNATVTPAKPTTAPVI
jgi:hypothetical protein